MEMAKIMTDFQYQIIGIVTFGKYDDAADLVSTDATQDNILVAMRAAYKDGYDEALKNVAATAANAMNAQKTN